MHVGRRTGVAPGKICKAIFLGLLPIAMVVPSGDMALSQSSTGSFTVTTIDFPTAVATYPYKINGTGQIVGEIFDASFKEHGFLRDVGGTFTQIDVPNSILTRAFGINDASQIVGTFATASGHGFLRDATGTFTTVDVPNATNTVATAINGIGQIVGYFTYPSNGASCTVSPEPPGCPHGFLRDVGGTFTMFDAPAATQTYAYGVNGSGQIVGFFLSANNTVGTSCAANPMPAGCVHGFLRDAAGTFTTIDDGSQFTQAFGINDAGQIVGGFVGTDSLTHGFLQGVGGTFTTLDVANSFQTVAFGVNSNSQIVGTFNTGSPNAAQGFLANGKLDPKLSVPRWFQVGIPQFPAVNGFIYNNWGSMQLDTEINYNPLINPPVGFATIAHHGCALTALTMVYNFWAGNLQSPTDGTLSPPYPGFAPANPADPKDKTVLNNAKGLFIVGSGQVTWPFALWAQSHVVKMYRECSSNNTDPSCTQNRFPVMPTAGPPDPTLTLVNILRNWVPVILPIQCDPTLSSKCNSIAVSSPGRPPEIHWVVVTGFNSKASALARFLVNDPGDQFTKTLDDVVSRPAVYAKGDGITPTTAQNSLNNINGWKVYTKVDKSLVPMDPNTPQALGVYSNAPVEFILTDPQGRRTGFDPVTNTSFQDIPASDYSASAYCDELGLGGCNSPFKTLEMANQMPGQYTLNVIGTGSGAFTVSVRASDTAGNFITQTYSGTTTPGATSQVTFQGAVTTFAAFAVNDLAISPSNQAFGVVGTFTLGPSGTISPVTQPVTIELGNAFLATIPAGSFTQTPQGTFTFGGIIQGVLLAAALTPTSGNSYAFAVAGAGAPNLPSTNPVDVRLAIGNNGGSTSVNATFVP